ncbi:response regulator [Roseibium algae]|uniref:Response regulator n=1 Tax=Roseibium algae TaxID=3123038 RepID=A0ABU8TPH7_9HYPH
MDRRWDLSQASFLVIDDNIHMRSILRSIVSGFGVRQIFEANDGADGLEIVLDRAPNFILLDWVMAPVSGADFIKILRAEKNEVINTIPVIVVSAHSRKNTIVEAVKLGAHGFIAKPVSPMVLYDRIADVLHKQSLHGPSKGIFHRPLKKPRQVLDVANQSGTKTGSRLEQSAEDWNSLSMTLL